MKVVYEQAANSVTNCKSITLRAGLDESGDVARPGLGYTGVAAVSDLDTGGYVVVAVLDQDGVVVQTELADTGGIVVAVLIGFAVVVDAFLADRRDVAVAVLVGDRSIDPTILDNADHVADTGLSAAGLIAQAKLLQKQVVGRGRHRRQADEGSEGA